MNLSIQVQVDTGSTFEVKSGAVVLFLSLTEQDYWPYEFLGCTYLHLSSADFTGMFSHIENSKFYFFVQEYFACAYVCASHEYLVSSKTGKE